ncbi:Phage hypothetical protein [Methylophaga frappieri]|uniref:Bacteriophage phiJL001 Gp84 C-terminal domain-containing protein n=1 Tax=Methylophaga frappieri (strain ATCC BAA-2434 / DSM 25690 / JAM7) TaxID=754477 RepID=I1YGH3_METFJ|nr:phage BR0599 family protein [Methylophaga frappieri]AFJ02016.1 Phage hypothetical protein [Methylophaga frappieri]
MTFNAYETSRHSGTPAEHLEIVYGDNPVDAVRMTTADYNVTINGKEYTSGMIKRDSISDDSNPYDGEQLKISLNRENPFADIYLSHEFANVITVTLYQSHLDDPDTQPVIVWSGRLAGVEWEYPMMILLSERMDLYMNGYALTMRYQIGQCVHTVYHGLCGLIKSEWEVGGDVTDITDKTVIEITEAGGYGDGYFTGGILSFAGINRYILQHVGNQVWLNRPIKSLIPVSAVKLYPGCNRLPQTCLNKFNNIDNYLAFDWTPAKDGYDGNSIF